MVPNPADPTAERRRERSTGDGWTERVVLEAHDATTGLAVAVSWVVTDHRGRGRIDVRVVRSAADPVAVIAHDLPEPVPGRFELRAPALWVDLVVERPFDHVTSGLEAFGVSVEESAELGPDVRGVRTPVGFDLEWESDGPVEPVHDAEGYTIPCRMNGEVLVGDESVTMEGTGRRSHSWGTTPGPF